GPDHPNTLATLNNLGRAYRAAGRVADAIRLHEEVRDVRVRKLGADHPDTLATMHDLAAAYETAGKFADAIRLYEETRQGRIAKLGPDHPQTLQTIICLARALVSDGRAAQAVEHFDFAVGSLDARHFQDPSAARCLAVILPGYEQAKEFAKAETWPPK